MTELFKNKYRIKSARLPYWDYNNSGCYFVTICAKNRKHCFGKIRNKIMGLSAIGIIVAHEWEKTEQIQNNVKLDEWIVMPNHLHGVVVIDNGDDNDRRRRDVATQSNCRDVASQRLYDASNPQMSKISPKSNSLSSIIRSFKSACTYAINKRFSNSFFHWQPRFYDHIIRNENELNRIREYIHYNPTKWEYDRNNPENIFM